MVRIGGMHADIVVGVLIGAVYTLALSGRLKKPMHVRKHIGRKGNRKGCA
jgi:hypothetical protein